MKHLLCALGLVLTGLLASPAWAVTYWDDELDEATTGFWWPGAPWCPTPGKLACNGEPGTGGVPSMAFDTSIKWSGTGSIRLDYPSVCLNASSECGGSTYRDIPQTNVLFTRYYVRISSGFQTSADSFTKLAYNHSTGNTTDLQTLGCCGGKGLKTHLQNVPSVGETTVVNSSLTFTDATWYCIEVEENKPTRTFNLWVNSALVSTQTNVNWPTGDWNSYELFRQFGVGSIWYDKFAVGNTRIGCSGAPPPSDTTNPNPPTNLQVQ